MCRLPDPALDPNLNLSILTSLTLDCFLTITLVSTCLTRFWALTPPFWPLDPWTGPGLGVSFATLRKLKEENYSVYCVRYLSLIHIPHWPEAWLWTWTENRRKIMHVIALKTFSQNHVFVSLDTQDPAQAGHHWMHGRWQTSAHGHHCSLKIREK